MAMSSARAAVLALSISAMLLIIPSPVESARLLRGWDVSIFVPEPWARVIADSGNTRTVCKDMSNLVEVAGNFVSAKECCAFAESYNARAFTYSDTSVDWDQQHFGDFGSVNMPCLVYSECHEWEHIPHDVDLISGDSFNVGSWSLDEAFVN